MPAFDLALGLRVVSLHRDFHARLAQPVGPGSGCELAALIHVPDLRRSEPDERLVQGFDTE
jgi:hypothetical protein